VDFAALTVVMLAALLGPLLAVGSRWHVPVVVGEVLVGVLLGSTGLGYLDPTDDRFAFLAEIGFALVMFVAGAHVPMRDRRVLRSLRTGVARAALVGAVASVFAVGIAGALGTGHAAVYAVVMASSSAALVLPVVEGQRLGGEPVLQLVTQVAVADVACIVALPFALAPRGAGRALLGVVTVLLVGALAIGVLALLEHYGVRRKVHRISERRKLAVELRTSLLVLFGLAAVATWSKVSVLLAGFVLGLGVSLVGEPRRLARQLFAVTEGFFGPVFFVWLGTSLDLRALAARPALVLLGLLLGLAAVASHAAARVLGQPLSLATLAAAQLGVPVAAATVGVQLHVLAPGEPAALLLGALVTVVLTAVAASWAVRQGWAEPPPAAGAVE
jgi:Kef-type K+ transport system membrane component KefB